MRIGRSLRGLAGMGLMWGAAWGTVLALLNIVVWVTIVRHWPVHQTLALSLLAQWIFGFSIGLVAGIAFGVLLGVVERRRSVGGLSVPRTALWGAIASALFAVPSIFLWPGPRSVPIPIGALLLSAAVVGVLGAGSAAVTLIAAQHAKALPGEAAQDLLTA